MLSLPGLALEKAAGRALWLVDEPAGCLSQKNYPCAVRALSAGTLDWNGAELRMASGSAVLLSGERKLRIISGTLGMNSAQAVTLREAAVQIEAVGEIWLEKPERKQVLVKNLQGEVKVKVLPRAGLVADEDQVLPPGFENWFSGMDTQGQIMQGTLRPLNPQKFLKSWNRLYKLPRKEAVEKIETYKELWKSAPERISALYAVSAQRMVASLEAEKEKERQQELARRAERSKLLKMFRDRYQTGGIP